MTYSYPELKGKIKVGDKVRAVNGKNNRCFKLNDNGSNEKEITEVTDDLFRIDGCYHSFNENASYLEIIEPKSTMNNEREEITWENLQKGDVIFDVNGNSRTILARIEDIVSLSFFSNSNHHHSWHSIQALKDNKYKLKTDKPKRKVTLAEIAEKFGEEVEVVE